MMVTLQVLMLFVFLTFLRQKVNGTEIIHGKKAPDGLMLYMASVQSNTNHVCGGFLISENVVVTAAHCDKQNPTSVVLGTHNLKKGVDGTMRYNVTRCRHPNFDKVESGNDIMLLKLSEKVQLNKKVQPIQIPKATMKLKDKAKCRVAGWGSTRPGSKVSDLSEKVPLNNGVTTIPIPSSVITLRDNQICSVAGWGYTENSYLSDDLRVVDVSVMNPRECKKIWEINLPTNLICAGGYGTKKGFCQGDSGGPLVCNGRAVGVVSFNRNHYCNYPDLPNVYTDISKYLQWINREYEIKEMCGALLVFNRIVK
ncbi:mast cell protease 1A-like [Anableps anableps]